MQNTLGHARRQAKFKGICKTRSNKWAAQITIGGQTTHIGTFLTEDDAARAYDNKAVEAFGEFAQTNFGKARDIINDIRALPTMGREEMMRVRYEDYLRKHNLIHEGN
jgi:RAV-like factor